MNLVKLSSGYMFGPGSCSSSCSAAACTDHLFSSWGPCRLEWHRVPAARLLLPRAAAATGSRPTSSQPAACVGSRCAGAVLLVPRASASASLGVQPQELRFKLGASASYPAARGAAPCLTMIYCYVPVEYGGLLLCAATARPRPFARRAPRV